MGAIQNALNQALGAGAGAVVGMAHVSEQKKQREIAEAKNKAEIASTEQEVQAKKFAYKNDTIEAAKAIQAHKENNFDPDVETASGTYKLSSLTAEQLNDLDEKGVESLAKAVDEIRGGSMRKERIERMEKRGNKAAEAERKSQEYEKALKDGAALKPSEFKAKYGMGKTAMRAELRQVNPKRANRELKKAYQAFEELSDRQSASRTLKFDIEAAVAKIERLKNVGGRK